jgi:hypothetical protein
MLRACTFTLDKRELVLFGLLLPSLSLVSPRWFG